MQYEELMIIGTLFESLNLEVEQVGVLSRIHGEKRMSLEIKMSRT